VAYEEKWHRRFDDIQFQQPALADTDAISFVNIINSLLLIVLKIVVVVVIVRHLIASVR